MEYPCLDEIHIYIGIVTCNLVEKIIIKFLSVFMTVHKLNFAENKSINYRPDSISFFVTRKPRVVELCFAKPNN